MPPQLVRSLLTGLPPVDDRLAGTVWQESMAQGAGVLYRSFREQEHLAGTPRPPALPCDIIMASSSSSLTLLEQEGEINCVGAS